MYRSRQHVVPRCHLQSVLGVLSVQQRYVWDRDSYLEVNRLSPDEPAAAAFAHELPVSDLYFPADGDDGGAAFDRHALKAVVVIVDMLRLGGNGPPVLR